MSQNPTTRRTPEQNKAEAFARTAAVREARRVEMGETAFAEFEAEVARLTAVAVHHVTCGRYDEGLKDPERYHWVASSEFGSAECAECCPSKRAGVVSGFSPLA